MIALYQLIPDFGGYTFVLYYTATCTCLGNTYLGRIYCIMSATYSQLAQKNYMHTRMW